MSAAEARGPVSRDPLVVNTQDGSCWLRRAVTREGRGLYALADTVVGAPDAVLATLADLAEHGLASMVDALPMPVGPEPVGAHWTDIPEAVDQYVAGIQARVDQAQSGHWYMASDTETWRPPGTVCTRVDGVHRNVGQINVLPADLALILHAHDDLTWCLDMVAKLRARESALLEERHSTNESVDDAAKALRADRDRIAELESTNAALRARLAELEGQRAALAERLRAGQAWQRGRLVSEDTVSQPELREVFGIPLAAPLGAVEADGITQRIAPVQAPREDVTPQVAKLRDLLAGQRAAVEDPHDGPLAHRYLVPRDLPAPDGAQ
jgi:hypothetical protein